METGVTLYVKFWDKMYHCILHSGPRFPQECRRRQGNFWAQQRTWGQVTSSGVFPDHKRSSGFSLLVSQSHLLSATPWTVAHQAPPVCGILQAEILEWVAIPFSRESAQSRDQN